MSIATTSNRNRLDACAASQSDCRPALAARPDGAGTEPRQPRQQEQLAGFERERTELHQVLSEAAWVHRKLCAPRQLRRGRFEIASEIFPIRHLSGDFFCISDTGTVTTLAIGDIAGKGFAAGMWVTLLVGLFHIHGASCPDPASAVSAFNRDLCLLQPDTPLTTMFTARLDWRAGKLMYCSAGHPPALHLHADGTVEFLQEGGPLLGVVPSAPFSAGHVVFEPGDTLLAYSDGLLECRSAEDQEFGMERLVREARRCLRSSAAEMVFSLLGAVRDFAGSQPREDDVTVMILRDAGAVRGEAGERPV